jgi:hypothetical protein
VKEHNQSLVDDSLVMSDKIGAANFFWSFPSQALHEQNLKKRNLEEMIVSSTRSCDLEQNRVEELSRERSAPDRPGKVCSLSDLFVLIIAQLQRLYELREELARVSRELEERKATDPEETQRILSAVELNKRASDRWTENIWSIKKYLTKKKGMSGKEVSPHHPPGLLTATGPPQVDKLLGIDGNFDYLTYTAPSASRRK